jgi:signal transduction histidine kinase
MPVGIRLTVDVRAPLAPYAGWVNPSPFTKRWLALDCVIATVCGLLTWGMLAHATGSRLLVVAGTALVCVPLAIGRRHPLVALPMPLAAFLLAPAFGATSVTFIAMAMVPMAGVVYFIAARYYRRYSQQKARYQITEERLRIARELHDIVAHSMSVITVQAGFGRLVVDEQPAQARTALAAIETTGRATLVEMRRMLGVLRADDPALSPPPGLADLDQLVAQTAHAGVQVDLTITGTPRELPAGMDLTAYRVIQEALTNVVKHADTATGRVVLDYGDNELSMEITDNGAGCPNWTEGHGLTGMRERVSGYGGQFSAGPLPEGGFHVTVRLPIEGVLA